MSDQFVGEIRVFGLNFAPLGWALCQGQLLSIAQNTALFSLLGTNFGGDGRSTFGLPNFQGAAAMHYDQGPGLSPRVIGEAGGEDAVTLLQNEMPSHQHALNGFAGRGGENVNTPSNGDSLTTSVGGLAYIPPSSAPPLVALASTTLQNSGGGQPHNNLMPYLTLNFCIALQGIFPPRG